MMRKSTMWSLSVIAIVLLAAVEGRTLDGGQGESPFSLDDIPIIKQVTPYSFFKDTPSKLICDACLEISQSAQAILSDPKLPEEIDSFSAEFCHILPPNMEAMCLKGEKDCIIRTISYLRNLTLAENLCYSTGLCSTNTAMAPSFLPSVSEAQSLQLPDFSLDRFDPELSDNKACTNCHNAMDAILNGLNDPKTKMKIINRLRKSCKDVKHRISHCKELVYLYAPIVLVRLQSYLINNDLCTALHLCNDAAPPPQMQSGA